MWRMVPIERGVSLRGVYSRFEKTLSSDFVYSGESHDFWELVLILSGTMDVTAGARTFSLSAGEAVLHPPMEFHALRAADGTEPHVMIFSFAAARMPDYETRVFRFDAETRALAARALRAFCEASGTGSGELVGDVLPGKERLAGLALSMLEQLLLSLREEDRKDAAAEANAGLLNYRRALSVLEENLSLPLSTEALAARARMSPSLLKKLFARYAGVGVMTYFRTRKVNAAVTLLREGASVSDVAAAFGFSDPAYFSTVCRRVTGFPPSHYLPGRKNRPERRTV